MQHTNILKRAWDILWRYKALWVFGILVAVAAGGGNGSSNSTWYNLGRSDFSPGGLFPIEDMPPGMMETLVAIGIGLGCLSLALLVATQMGRYVGEVALIRMVEHHEETGEKRSIRQGFQMGWSVSTLRLFLIDLVVGVPTALAFLLVFALALAPLLLWLSDSDAAGALGTVLAVGLVLVAILLAVVVGAALTLLKHFFRRVCVLEKQGVMESIRQGYAFVRRNLRDVGLMWLVMVGVSVAWGVVLIPVSILVVAAGAALGGGLGLAVFGLGEAAGEAMRWVAAVLSGLPVFLLVVSVPLTLLGGLMETFKSATWTLTYRELRALESGEPSPPQLAERPPEGEAA